MPIRPLGLAGDLLHAGPGEAVAADADAVADRAAATEHVIEVGVGGIDDDGARGLLGREGHFLAAQMRRKLRRADFRLLFRRQRGKLHRPAVGADAGCCGCGSAPVAPGVRRSADRSRRTQASAVVVRIDDAGTGNAAVAAIRIDRLLRSGRAVAIDHRRRTGRAAVTRIVGRKDRARRHRSATVRIDRASAGGHSGDRWATSPDRAAATRPRSDRSAPRHRPARRNRVRRGRGVHRSHSRRAHTGPEPSNRPGRGVPDSPAAPERAKFPPCQRQWRHKSSECGCSSSPLYRPQAPPDG